jgi:demethylsterigmatocystin 6-O-methyltransferase
MYTTLPPLQALPGFLDETLYANPSDLYHAPFQKGMNTDLSKFEWQASQPELREAFGRWMAAQHTRQMTWLSVLDFTDYTRSSTPQTPVFVDVGGGIGHQCALLREHIPRLVGRVILQDSALVLENALPISGLEKMPHDFWKEQPVKGMETRNDPKKIRPTNAHIR